MSVFQISLEKLLKHCELPSIPPVAGVFSEAHEGDWIHSVPRLLIQLDGELCSNFFENGKATQKIFRGMNTFFCTRNGYFHSNEKREYPSRALSFSFFPGHIRAMFIDSDGITPPPTERDIFWHTYMPLSPGGMALIQAMEALAHEHQLPLFNELCQALYSLTIKALQESTAAPITRQFHLTERLNNFLREHREEPLSREDVARFFSISPGYVSTLCLKYLGASFSELTLKYRLEHACNLLLKSHMSVDEIAFRSGFSSANYFIRRFKKAYGVTPHVYRNK